MFGVLWWWWWRLFHFFQWLTISKMNWICGAYAKTNKKQTFFDCFPAISFEIHVILCWISHNELYTLTYCECRIVRVFEEINIYHKLKYIWNDIGNWHFSFISNCFYLYFILIIDFHYSILITSINTVALCFIWNVKHNEKRI